ncbi:DNA-binding transcriptional regulator, ArsR family [Microbulbifer donghaiensis]|uniref:DNA-binding transcriptional regulator, ArsR family n=1 Tax=Microbulbifer donghaiensis TaxID=494016 RepID=A0A1M5GS06_9GAMM|nr:metalloregulator ArsR/SmtB family transcription factor [Microbulbifer donghaiensis]SHG06519.1 DNA-binding transcriptional regulator, ArsR family [Microbulbifer donghaiensis]
MSTPLDLLANASQAAALLKAMSNENRLMVLCCLQEGEMSVSELNEVVPLSQSALSQHLAALRSADLVATRRDGNTIYYRLHGEAPSAIVSVLHDLYCPR